MNSLILMYFFRNHEIHEIFDPQIFVLYGIVGEALHTTLRDTFLQGVQGVIGQQGVAGATGSRVSELF